MRMLVFFDLPVVTPEDRTNYRRFHKLLITNGFIMMQESVYCRMLTSPTAERNMVEFIKKNRPPKGLVQTLTVTEKQFARMEYIVGESKTDIINSVERLVIL